MKGYLKMNELMIMKEILLKAIVFGSLVGIGLILCAFILPRPESSEHQEPQEDSKSDDLDE